MPPLVLWRGAGTPTKRGMPGAWARTPGMPLACRRKGMALAHRGQGRGMPQGQCLQIPGTPMLCLRPWGQMPGMRAAYRRMRQGGKQWRGAELTQSRGGLVQGRGPKGHWCTSSPCPAHPPASISRGWRTRSRGWGTSKGWCTRSKGRGTPRRTIRRTIRSTSRETSRSTSREYRQEYQQGYQQGYPQQQQYQQAYVRGYPQGLPQQHLPGAEGGLTGLPLGAAGASGGACDNTGGRSLPGGMAYRGVDPFAEEDGEEESEGDEEEEDYEEELEGERRRRRRGRGVEQRGGWGGGRRGVYRGREGARKGGSGSGSGGGGRGGRHTGGTSTTTSTNQYKNQVTGEMYEVRNSPSPPGRRRRTRCLTPAPTPVYPGRVFLGAPALPQPSLCRQEAAPVHQQPLGSECRAAVTKTGDG